MTAEQTLEQIREELAAIEHERWSHWQKYLHGKGVSQPDGSILLPSELVSKWERLIATSYGELTEKEKQSDRDQVDRYIPIIAKALSITD
ncbi:hypothetical protein [Luteibacter yeojuensis]|uniref:Uncharacterized protein n=1 Tax=Luteibacter yeojuensis TaxID=345309 RepID=A0A0F3L098_9GAMM|nr:hypothetical protein [Luteibacter yeojuensis]KJV36965.1 hypothetical protein VI08_01860 [Luteibacter yeojuensis]